MLEYHVDLGFGPQLAPADLWCTKQQYGGFYPPTTYACHATTVIMHNERHLESPGELSSELQPFKLTHSRSSLINDFPSPLEPRAKRPFVGVSLPERAEEKEAMTSEKKKQIS